MRLCSNAKARTQRLLARRRLRGFQPLHLQQSCPGCGCGATPALQEAGRVHGEAENDTAHERRHRRAAVGHARRASLFGPSPRLMSRAQPAGVPPAAQSAWQRVRDRRGSRSRHRHGPFLSARMPACVRSGARALFAAGGSSTARASRASPPPPRAACCCRARCGMLRARELHGGALRA